MIKAVLFDLDGVLLDTAEGSIDSFKYACKQMGFSEPSNEELMRIIGPPVQMSFHSFFNCSDSEIQKATKIFREYYKSEALFKAYAYDGILCVMEELKRNKILIGVATYKREDYANSILEHFGISKFCDVIHGADEDGCRSKTDIINLCINDLSVNKQNIVLIGDTKHDAEGAIKANIKFIGATYGYGFKCKEEVDIYNNIGTIEHPSELINKIL